MTGALEPHQKEDISNNVASRGTQKALVGSNRRYLKFSPRDACCSTLRRLVFGAPSLEDWCVSCLGLSFTTSSSQFSVVALSSSVRGVASWAQEWNAHATWIACAFNSAALLSAASDNDKAAAQAGNAPVL